MSDDALRILLGPEETFPEQGSSGGPSALQSSRGRWDIDGTFRLASHDYSVGPAERKVNVILKYAVPSVLLFRRGVVCGKQFKVSVRMEELNSTVPSDCGDQKVGGRNRYTAFPTVSREFNGSGPDIRRSRYRLESIDDSLQLCAFSFSPRTVP